MARLFFGGGGEGGGVFSYILEKILTDLIFKELQMVLSELGNLL